LGIQKRSRRGDDAKGRSQLRTRRSKCRSSRVPDGRVRNRPRTTGEGLVRQPDPAGVRGIFRPIKKSVAITCPLSVQNPSYARSGTPTNASTNGATIPLSPFPCPQMPRPKGGTQFFRLPALQTSLRMFLGQGNRDRGMAISLFMVDGDFGRAVSHPSTPSDGRSGTPTNASTNAATIPLSPFPCPQMPRPKRRLKGWVSVLPLACSSSLRRRTAA